MAKKKEDKIKRLRRPGEPIIVNSKAYGFAVLEVIETMLVEDEYVDEQ